LIGAEDPPPIIAAYPGPHSVWVVPPTDTDTPDFCASWFVWRVDEAVWFAWDAHLLWTDDSRELLDQPVINKDLDFSERAANLVQKVSTAVEDALAADRLNAASAGLLDSSTGLPLSWLRFHERALKAHTYPIAAHIAAVIAHLP
jgi:hypothetical protein